MTQKSSQKITQKSTFTQKITLKSKITQKSNSKKLLKIKMILKRTKKRPFKSSFTQKSTQKSLTQKSTQKSITQKSGQFLEIILIFPIQSWGRPHQKQANRHLNSWGGVNTYSIFYQQLSLVILPSSKFLGPEKSDSPPSSAFSDQAFDKF